MKQLKALMAMMTRLASVANLQILLNHTQSVEVQLRSKPCVLSVLSSRHNLA